MTRRTPEPARRTVILTCGLPASGKTTTAERLHAALGGALIRSCDVFARLGIDLPAWVRRTRGFTAHVGAYERLRDRAYAEMARLLRAELSSGGTLVIIDAVHAERDKRRAVLDICASRRARAALVWCRCDDLAETERRLAARRGHEAIPENEASDLSVYRHLAALWDDPLGDGLPAALGCHDTGRGTFRWLRAPATAPVLARIPHVLAPPIAATR